MIPLSSLELDECARAYVNDALDRNWISGVGDYIPRFETALAEKIGRKHAIAVSNGTDALELALKGLGVGPGDEVIVPALTFAAPAAAVVNVGAKPVFVDVDVISWTIDPEQIVVTDKTKAIIAVDSVGHPADYDAIRLAAPGIPILQDAAEAHGALYKGVQVGVQGDVTIFSFHSNKGIPIGEGGAVLTDDDLLMKKMRIIANHGMTDVYWHDVVGSNYRMPNLQAAIGLAQVQRWDELIAERQRVADLYNIYLPSIVGRRYSMLWATAVCWLYCITTHDRSRVIDAMRHMDIDVRPLWRPLPEMPPYQDGKTYPNAEWVSSGGLLLPTWAGMPAETIEFVSSVLSDCLVEKSIA